MTGTPCCLQRLFREAMFSASAGARSMRYSFPGKSRSLIMSTISSATGLASGAFPCRSWFLLGSGTYVSDAMQKRGDAGEHFGLKSGNPDGLPSDYSAAREHDRRVPRSELPEDLGGAVRLHLR